MFCCFLSHVPSKQDCHGKGETSGKQNFFQVRESQGIKGLVMEIKKRLESEKVRENEN